MFFMFVLVYVSVFVCLFVHQCVVVQLSVSYGNLNVSLWGLQTMSAHSFLNFISIVIREKDEFIFSLESATSIQKPRNLLKVAYHPASCLLYHYTCKFYWWKLHDTYILHKFSCCHNQTAKISSNMKKNCLH